MDPFGEGRKNFDHPTPKFFFGGAECSAKTTFLSFFRQKSGFGEPGTHIGRGVGAITMKNVFLKLYMPMKWTHGDEVTFRRSSTWL